MGQNQKHVLGRNQRFYANPEATFAVPAKPAGTDALKVLTSTMEFVQERVDRNDARQTRSWLERITRRKTVSWSLEAFLNPSGAAGTPPDIGALIKAAMGIETAGATVVYTLSPTQAALGSLTLVREFNKILSEAAFGAWVESMTISVAGGEEPKVSFEGGGADHAGTGANGLTAGVEAALQTVIGLGAGQAKDYDVGSFVAFVNPTTDAVVDDNGAAGYEVTLVDETLDEITVSPGLVIGAGAGDRVIPFVPTEVTAGSPIAGINGSLLLDAASLPITALELNLVNTIKALNDEVFEDAATDYIPGNRDVTGTVTVRARRDEIILLGERKSFPTQSIDIILGTGAGTKFELDIPTAEFEFSPVEVPESEEGTFTLPFKALGASGEDEFSLTHS